MANVALSTLLPLINLPRCPENLILQALREASRRFLTESEVWRENISFTTVTGQTSYTLTNSYSSLAFIRRVVSVQVGTALKGWTFARPTTLTFSSAPLGSVSGTAFVVFVPVTVHSELPDWIIDVWGEAIAHCAAFLLKSDVGSKTDPHPWADIEGATTEKGKFDVFVQEARLDVMSKLPPASTFAYLQDYCSSNLQRCPEQFIYQSLLDTCRDFVQSTEIWQEEIEVTTVVSQTAYTLTLASGAIVSRIVSVRTDEDIYDESEWDFDRSNNTITFETAPTSIDTIYVRVVYVPISTSFDIPEWMVDKWGMIIANGAIASQKSRSTSEWSDAEGAKVMQARYDRGLAEAMREARAKRQFADPQLFVRDYCLENLQGCPEAMIYQSIRDTTNEFFKETEIWRSTIEVTAVADQTDYSLVNPYSYADFHRVVSVAVDDLFIEENEWSFSNSGVLTLETAIDAGKTIEVEVVYIPKHTKVPSVLSDKWGMVIAHGAIFRQKSNQGSLSRPNAWYDPNGAAIEQRYFYTGINEAKHEVFSKRKSGDTGIQMREF